MIDLSQNHFELFGLPQRYRCDMAALDRAYRRLQSDVHPDRHAGGSDAQKRAALQASARVNEAYRALKDAVARAQYLLQLQGIDAFDETDTALPLEFLERQLERREAADEAMAQHDERALSALIDGVRSDAAEIESGLAQMLDDQHAYAAARMPVRELKFLGKLAFDIDELQASLTD